jgi:hypothetical protein
LGERGGTLFRIACSLRARRCEYPRILSELKRVKPGAVFSADRGSPRRHARELEKIAESVVSRYPAGKVIRSSEYELPRTRQPVENSIMPISDP